MGKTSHAKKLGLSADDFSFCVELPIKAKRADFKICTTKSHERARIAGEKNIPVMDYVRLRAMAHPIQKIASTVEIANAIIYMSSPLSSFTTGEIQVLDGGLSTTNWFNASKLMKALSAATLSLLPVQPAAPSWPPPSPPNVSLRVCII